jgi:ligand-binding sensor domain-containing protein
MVWIGTDRSLNRWDRRTNTWRVYRNDPARRGSPSNGPVTAIAEDPDGTPWVGGRNNGLSLFDRQPQLGRRDRHLRGQRQHVGGCDRGRRPGPLRPLDPKKGSAATR